jgi:hypothetical protein
MRWKTAAIVAASSVTALVLVLAGTVIVVHVKHPRDESAYFEYLRLYGRGEQTGTTATDFTDAPIELPAIPALLAEGDRACAWLSHQSFALWRTDPSHRVDAMYERYVASRHDATQPWEGDPQRDSVVAAAWQYLCPATRELHKPHYAFSSPPSD